MSNTKDLVRFLISEFAIQTETAMEKAKPKHKFGKVKTLTYMVTKDRQVVQRLTWDNFKGSTVLKPEEKKKMEQTFQMNIDDEFEGRNAKGKKVVSIMCSISVKKCEIKAQYEYEDGEVYKIVI